MSENLVFITVLYACESKTINKTDQDKILAFVIYYYILYRILHLNRTMKVTNEDIQRRLNIKEGLIQTTMRKKLSFVWHTCKTEKQKIVMIVIIDGNGRRGRSNMEWMGDIKDRCKKALTASE